MNHSLQQKILLALLLLRTTTTFLVLFISNFGLLDIYFAVLTPVTAYGVYKNKNWGYLFGMVLGLSELVLALYFNPLSIAEAAGKFSVVAIITIFSFMFYTKIWQTVSKNK